MVLSDAEKKEISALVGALPGYHEGQTQEVEKLCSIAESKFPAAAAFVSSLSASRSKKVRHGVALFFSMYPVQEAVEPLTRLISDKDAFIRSVAVAALGHTPGSPEALQALTLKARDPDSFERENAFHALTDLGPVAVPALLELLKDPLPAVRMPASHALVTMDLRHAEAILSDIRDAVRRGRIGHDDADTIVRSISSRSKLQNGVKKIPLTPLERLAHVKACIRK